MKKLCFLCVGLMLFAVSSAFGQERKTASYYPLEVGNTWHYRADINGMGKQVTSKIVAIEKIGGRDLARLEGVMDGKTIATEHLAVDSRGVYRHQFNGMPSDPPFLLLRTPVKPGDKWEGTARLGKGRIEYTAVTKEEMIETPAGKFNAIRVDIDLVEQGNRVVTSYWFAENVGMVKQTVEAGPVNLTLVLERFERAKK